MSKETKNMMKLIVLVGVIGIVCLSVFSSAKIVSWQPQETYQWLKATQIIFGF